MNVWLTHSDGQYGTRPLTDEEAADAKAKGCTVVYVRREVWEAWEVHLRQSAVWDTLWTMLNNEHYRGGPT